MDLIDVQCAPVNINVAVCTFGIGSGAGVFVVYCCCCPTIIFDKTSRFSVQSAALTQALWLEAADTRPNSESPQPKSVR